LVAFLIVVYTGMALGELHDRHVAEKALAEAKADLNTVVQALNGAPLRTEDGEFVRVSTTIIKTGKLIE
jgi:hypothetical protein